MTSHPETKAVRGAVWTVSLFYMLIVFEFFYMASPFALYFYGAYLPGLEFMNQISQLAWLTSFFLPHFAPTSSALVNAAPIVGGLLTLLGVLGFLVGAVQVYSRKLLKQGAVTGGIYKYFRHPQYASLILAGIGMLLLWPRFLMAGFFVTMLFAYHTLAMIEERECIKKFGRAYIDYQRRTPRFLPFQLPFTGFWSALPQGRPVRAVAGVSIYAASLGLVFGMALVVQYYTLHHLYTYKAENAVYIALMPTEGGALEAAANSAAADPRVIERIGATSEQCIRFINYVMPWEWGVSEIPMNGEPGHRTPGDYDDRRFKIVYTKALLRAGGDAQGLDIPRQAIRTEAVGEAWVDESGRVVQVLGPPARAFYGSVPVPVF